MNHLKTFILLAALTALFAGVGYLIGGATGMAIALVFAAAFLLALIAVVVAVALRRRGFTQSFSGDVNGAIVIPFGHQP